MPYYGRKRAYRSKKRTYRRKKYSRRGRTATSKRFGTKYLFKRTVLLSPLSANGGSNSISALNFKLSDLPSYTDFTNMFQKYKISAVKIMLYPKYIDTTGTDVVQNTRVFIATVRDADSSITTLDAIRSQQDCKVHFSTKRVIQHYVKSPAFPQVINQSMDGSSNLTTRPATGYLDREHPDIQHYGVYMGFEGSDAVQIQYYRREAVFYLSMRDPC